MPVFIERGNLKRDWEGEISLSVAPEILMNPETDKFLPVISMFLTDSHLTIIYPQVFSVRVGSGLWQKIMESGILLWVVAVLSIRKRHGWMIAVRDI